MDLLDDEMKCPHCGEECYQQMELVQHDECDGRPIERIWVWICPYCGEV